MEFPGLRLTEAPGRPTTSLTAGRQPVDGALGARSAGAIEPPDLYSQ